MVRFFVIVSRRSRPARGIRSTMVCKRLFLRRSCSRSNPAACVSPRHFSRRSRPNFYSTRDCRNVLQCETSTHNALEVSNCGRRCREGTRGLLIPRCFPLRRMRGTIWCSVDGGQVGRTFFFHSVACETGKIRRGFGSLLKRTGGCEKGTSQGFVWERRCSCDHPVLLVGFEV